MHPTAGLYSCLCCIAAGPISMEVRMTHSGNNGWNSDRWHNVARTYTHEEVVRLRGTVEVEYSIARAGAEKFWRMLHQESYVPALGALTGNQAVQMATAGLK